MGAFNKTLHLIVSELNYAVYLEPTMFEFTARRNFNCVSC